MSTTNHKVLRGVLYPEAHNNGLKKKKKKKITGDETGHNKQAVEVPQVALDGGLHLLG